MLWSPELIRTTASSGIPTDIEVDKEMATFKAMVMILRADAGRFSELQTTLFEGVYKGQDEFPTTVTAAYDLLQHISGDITSYTKPLKNGRPRFRRGRRLPNFTFTQTSDPKVVPGNDSRVYPHITCRNCHLPGHYANQCPSKKNITLAHFSLTQKKMELINKNWLLLDTCSTISVCCNPNLVNNIKPCPPGHEVTVVTNGGAQSFEKEATLNILPIRVHFNHDSLANILSLSDVANLPGARLTMDSQVERAIILHLNQEEIKFLECSDGLYYWDSSSNKSKPSINIYSPSSTNNLSLTQTVAKNKEFFTKRDVQGADKARVLQSVIGWPSTTKFNHIINSNLINNCPINVDDVKRADVIYAPPTPLLQGNMTRSTPRKVSTLTTSIPPYILNNYPTLQLYIDFVYINKQPFLHTKSSHIKFLTIQHAINRTQGTIKRLLISTIDKYHSRGFTITDIFGDNEFDVASLHEFFRPITIHICAPEEHVPQIERQNRTTKERLRTICHSLPYKRYTKLMTIHLAEYANHWENAFPSPSGVSTTISPASIVEGRKKPDFNHQHLAFGTYALIYIGTKNNLKARSVPAIALKPSNDWGGFYFMSLITGKRLHAFKWTELPINEEVIERIDDLARKENQPILSNGTVLIEWNIENESGSSEQYETALEVEEPPPAESDIVTHNDEVQNSVENETLERIEEHMNEAMIAVNEENDSTILEDCNDHHLVNDSNDFFENDELSLDSDDESEEHLFVPDQVTNESTPRRALTNVRSTSLLPTQDTSTENDPEPTENINIEEDTQQVPEGPFLRSERPRRLAAMRGIDRMEPTLGGKEHISYRRKLGLLQKRQERLTHRAQVCLMMRRIRRETHSEKQFTQVMTNVTFLSAQMSAKQGFKKFGERAIMAMLKECEQLDRGAFPGKPVVEPMYLNDLTDLERRAAMTVVSLIKEKRCGKLKGRMCANGSTQKRYLQPEESITSPTVSNEGLLSTFVIDAYEGRNIAVVDIPGAYLHAGVNHDKRRVIIKLQDEFVDMMCQVNEKYKAYVCYEKGRKTLYLKLLRALYGCIESALLWYELFTSTLKNMGFSLNPYDKCIANKIINGSQCTIVWYVDDAKISHIDESVIKNIVKCLENKFGKLNPTYGNKQEYLGMKIIIDDSRRLHIDMRDQICEVLDDFSESIAGNVSTPAAKHLMDVDPNSVPLYKTKADEFHSTTAKLLYLEKRGRPDIKTAISFLIT